MKKLTLCLSYLLLSQLGFSQGWLRQYADSVTNTASSLRFWDVVQTPDNGYLSVGTADYASNITNERAVIVKADAEGRTTARYMKVFPHKRLALVKTTGNQIFAYSDYFYPALLKLANNGDVVWRKDLAAPLNMRLDVMKSSKDGNLFAFGAENLTTVFCKVNTNGDTLWRRKLPINSTPPFADFIEDTNGDILFVAAGIGGNIFLKLNAAGNTLVAPLLMVTGTDDFGKIRGLRRLSNGDFQYIYNTFRIGGYAQKCTKNGQFIASSYVNGAIFNEDNLIVPTRDDAYITLKAYNTGRVDGDHHGYDFFKIRQVADSLKIDWTQTHLDYIIGRQYADIFKMIETVDKGFIACGVDSVYERRRAMLLKVDSAGLVYSKTIRGRVVGDRNADCRVQTTDLTLRNMLIKADGGSTEKVFYTTTDAAGNYEMPVDTGRYRLSVANVDSVYRSCFPDSIIDFPSDLAVRTYDMPLKAAQFCAKAEVNIGSGLLRRCFDNTYRIEYCNKGTLPLQNGYIDLTLDTALIFQSSTLPIVTQLGQKIRLAVGNLDVFECKTAAFVAKVTCDTPSVLGRTLCVEAHIYPDTTCPTWSNANVVASAVCNTDSVRLSVQNAGKKATATPVIYSILADSIIISRGQINLAVNARHTIALPRNGRTYRIQATQEPNAPFNKKPTAFVEGCGRNGQGGISLNYVNVFDKNDGDAFISTHCHVVVGSYDPNDKEGLPLGYGAQRFVEPNQDIEYRIRFQNTGTDTAFTVVLRDTLSPFLAVESVEFGASSHPYQAEIIDKKVLKFTFNNILLPDSFVNVVKSVGFVKFRIKQKKDVVLGARINNSAGIYFDFNEPIQTNRTLHTVSKNFIISATVDKPLVSNVLIKVYPNPFSNNATFEVENVNFTEGGHFEVYNAVGQVVRREKIPSNRFEFERKELTSGIYFFKITEGSKIIGSGKLVVQ